MEIKSLWKEEETLSLSQEKLYKNMKSISHFSNRFSKTLIELKSFLEKNGIPAMIYYPVPLNEQNAFKNICKVIGNLENTYKLCESVLSLPIHTEMTIEIQDYIIGKIKEYYKK